MYDAESLLDLHERGHRNLQKLLAHCAGFEREQIDREVPGFGYPTIRLQLLHEIGAEAYWIGVLQDRMDVDEQEGVLRTIDAVADRRAAVAAETRRYLSGATPQALNTPRRMTTWGGAQHDLVPARVVLRTFSHLYHHQGQIMAMCRLLGRPASGMDFPLD
jgi:uncharacterized damage-inducible protein DinB